MEKDLGYKDPSEFRTQRVLGRYVDNALALETIGAPIDFNAMKGYRENHDNREMTPEQVAAELNSRTTGHAFSNIGVSVFPIIYVGEQPYTALVKQQRKGCGFHDTVWKLISEYVEHDEINNPMNAALRGISEEFYIETKEGLLVPGIYRLNAIGQPYGKDNYDDSYAFQVANCDDEVREIFSLPGTVKKKVSMNGQDLEGSPEAYFHLPSNSMQLIYFMHFDIPRILQKVGTLRSAEKHHLKAKKADIHHTEEQYQDGRLIIRLDEEGLILAKLAEGRLTDEHCHYLGGELHNARLHKLSEAFAPKQDGITSASNISLEEYLK